MKTVRRDNLTADRLVQRSLMKRVLMHWCIFFVVALIVSAIAKACSESTSNLTWAEFFDVFVGESIPFIIATLAFAPAFVFDTQRISHRFAGPMVRIRRCMGEIVAGQKVPRINFRAGDFWHDVAHHFNMINERLPNNNSTPPTVGDELKSSPSSDELVSV